MSKHIKVDGKLLQVNKRYSQLKARQREKIAEWMYQAYKAQVAKRLSDDEAINLVWEKIEEDGIWIPLHQIEEKYRSRKSKFKKRLDNESIPRHIFEMQAILNRIVHDMDMLEKEMAKYEQLQGEVEKLKEYFDSQQWKEDSKEAKERKYPERFAANVLSEAKIRGVLQRNQELLDRIRDPKRCEDDEHPDMPEQEE